LGNDYGGAKRQVSIHKALVSIRTTQTASSSKTNSLAAFSFRQGLYALADGLVNLAPPRQGVVQMAGQMRSTSAGSACYTRSLNAQAWNVGRDLFSADRGRLAECAVAERQPADIEATGLSGHWGVNKHFRPT